LILRTNLCYRPVQSSQNNSGQAEDNSQGSETGKLQMDCFLIDGNSLAMNNKRIL
jgi:hypothetical protein